MSRSWCSFQGGSIAAFLRTWLGKARKLACKLLLGRGFTQSLERNREAAERLDAVLNEVFRR